MNEQKHRRRNILIDKPLQLSIAFTVAGMIALMGVILGAAMFILPDGDGLQVMSAESLRTLLIGTHAAYFLLTAGSMAVAAIVITHRVAGPAYALTIAIGKMRKGDYTGRFNLRKKDYLKELASQLKELAHESELKEKRIADQRARALSFMDQGDIEAARNILKAEESHANGESIREPVAAN